MNVLGWSLFGAGGLLLFFFAIIGVDSGLGNVTNIAGTLTGVATMISGAVFVVGDRIERAIKGYQVSSSISSTKRKEGETQEGETQEDESIPLWGWAVIAAGFVLLIVLGETVGP